MKHPTLISEQNPEAPENSMANQNNSLAEILDSKLDEANTPNDARIELMGIPIDNVTMETAIQQITQINRMSPPKQVSFVNANCINVAAQDKQYRSILKNSDFIFADGIGMKIAGQVLQTPIVDNVNGSDLFPNLCEAINSTGIRLFLLGGLPEVNESVKQWIEENYPKVLVCGVRDGYFADSQELEVIAEIKQSQADILLVAFGVPLQEKWLSKNLVDTGAKLGIGVGGLFDFYSGRIPRAPVWMRRCKLEWTFRFMQEPRRLWKRYLVGNCTFLVRVGLHRIQKSLAKYFKNLASHRAATSSV